jgi:hypothetical protein
MPYYQSPTLLLSLGLSVRVFWQLLRHRPDVIHVSSPGMLVFAAILYSKLLAIPLVRNLPSRIFSYFLFFHLCGFALRILRMDYIPGMVSALQFPTQAEFEEPLEIMNSGKRAANYI